ncbi:hypothetical protein F4604DRAFT_1676968 [Suillus subluteus]|nr:hypothetical protein F4604DRAFT_1676968 [Suillus subluteus]
MCMSHLFLVVVSSFNASGLNTIVYSKGETYHGPYHCDEDTGVVTGNPALSAAIQDMIEVLKNNKGAEEGSRNYVSAMTIKDMQKLMACKGWHQKGKIDGALKGYKYKVYAQPKTPKICIFMHLQAWTLTWICTKAGLSARYTSHCFHQGGTRYRFMFTPLGECWLLATIHWWGAWAEGESVDMLIRYILDKLTRYKKNHQDALCPIPQEGDKSFNSDYILTVPITAAETWELKISFDYEFNHLSGKVEEVLDKLTLAPASSSYSSLLPPPSQSPILISTLASSSQYLQLTLCHQATAPFTTPAPVPMDSTSCPLPHTIPTSQVPPSNSHQHSAAAKKAASIPGIGIPYLLHGPEAWCTAVKQWEDPVASISGKALKDWPEEWYTGPMRMITGVKWNIHKVITVEFYWLQQDKGVFLEAYPEAIHGVKPLFNVIQCQHRGHREITG